MARRSRKKQRVPSLSEDLVLEILSRVPYRSLCRFKCVSRSWLALCSDPDLRKKSPQTLSGFFCFPRQEDDHDSPGSSTCPGEDDAGRPLSPSLGGLYGSHVRGVLQQPSPLESLEIVSV